MDDLTLSLIIVVITAGFIAALFLYLNVRKRRQDNQLLQAAREHGWQIQTISQPLRSGYLIQGKFITGDWSLETVAEATSRESGPGSSEVGHKTRWWTAAITLPDRAVVIGPRPGGPSGASALPDLSQPLLQLGLKAMLGEDAAWASGLTLMETGSKALEERYLCLAASADDIRRLLSPEVENALLHLPDGFNPVIKLYAGGLEISLPTRQLLEHEDIDRVVWLGKSLVDAWQDGDKIKNTGLQE